MVGLSSSSNIDLEEEEEEEEEEEGLSRGCREHKWLLI